MDRGAEQSGDVSALPPAVVLDLDETVLDNSPFQARAIQWQVAERAAGRMAEGFDPAAGRVVRGSRGRRRPRCRRLPAVCAFEGRDAVLRLEPDGRTRGGYRRNLAAVGIEALATPDTVLLRNERPEWAASDKTARRAHVARTHRILLLIGDDLRRLRPGRWHVRTA